MYMYALMCKGGVRLKRVKKPFALLLAVCMVLTVLPVAAKGAAYNLENMTKGSLDAILGQRVADFNFAFDHPSKGKAYQPYVARYLSAAQCVGYVYARAEERLRLDSVGFNSGAGAKDMIGNAAKVDGKKLTSTATGLQYTLKCHENDGGANLMANSFACFNGWGSGLSTYGHVIYVEAVIKDGGKTYVYYSEGGASARINDKDANLKCLTLDKFVGGSASSGAYMGCICFEPVCTHTYDTVGGVPGKCSKCGYVFPYAVTDISGTAVTSKAQNLKDGPYADNAKCGKIENGKTVTLLGKTVNAYGHTWYKVKYGSYTGWALKDYLKSISEGTPAGSCSFNILYNNSAAHLTNLTQSYLSATGVTLSGTITSKYAVKSVKIQFVNTSTGAVSSKPAPQTVKPNSTTVNVLKAVDPYAWYAQLPVGSYKCQLVVTDSNNNTFTNNSSVFTVVQNAAAQPMPVCALPGWSSANVDGGVRYTLTTSTSGATVKYTAGSQTGSGTGSVSFTLKQSASVSVTVTKSGYTSASQTKSVTVPVCTKPTITSLGMTASGLKIQMSAGSGESIRYRINGGSEQVYSQPFVIAKSSTITATAKKSGSADSAAASAYFSLAAPSTPVLSLLGTGGDIAEGAAISLKWNADANAAGYDLTVLKDGEEFLTKTGLTGRSYSFATSGAGVYTATLTASNVMGKSGDSAPVSVTAHAPLTVTFKNYDGSVLSEQSVRYGGAASAPEAPARKGHTFNGWDKSFSSVTADLAVTALFTVNRYTVRFYDTNGVTLLSTQYITYDQPADDKTPAEAVTLKTGYGFAGWHITDCESGSAQDLAHVDSDMKLVAVAEWKDAELPVVITDLAAQRNAECTGYNVSFKTTVAPAAQCGADTKKVKFIVTLKSAEDQMLGAAVVTENLTAEAQDIDQSVFISYDGSYLADSVEVTTVGIDGNDRTGGALSEPVTAEPQVTALWTDWMTSTAAVRAGYDYLRADAEKTQYRYTDSTRSTTTVRTTATTAPTKSGWTYTGSYSSEWGSWSGWSDSYIASTSTRQVQTQQVTVTAGHYEYRYGRWQSASGTSYCNTTCNKYYGGTPTVAYTAWSATRQAESGKYYTCGNISGYGAHTHYHGSDPYGDAKWALYNIGGDGLWNRYFWEETRYVAPTYKTQYSYRDKYYTYTYEKWTSNSTSDWSDDVYTPYTQTNQKRTVSTRLLYRFLTNDITVTELENRTEERTLEGRIDVDEELSGKFATVLVYKETNFDPTEPQLEYVGTTEIGSENSYSVSFRPKEEPSDATGDFVVAFAIKGAGNVVNVGKVMAPGSDYRVAFYGLDGEELFPEGMTGTQTVREGEAAVKPAAPEVPGYRFVCWDNDTSCVMRDLAVSAVYVPLEYSVVIADFENETVTLKTDYSYGDALTIPDTPSHEGKTFAGWSVTENSTGKTLTGDEITVTDDLIVVALWEDVTVPVRFLGEDGTVLELQQVAFGESAVPPEYGAVSEGKVFLGWSTDVCWWDISGESVNNAENGSVDVYPIIAFAETAMTPITDSTEVRGNEQYITLECEEGAEIYYTLVYTWDAEEGEMIDPEPGAEDTFLYTGPILVEDSITVRARAYKENKNPSEVVDVEFWYVDGLEDMSEIEQIEVGTYHVTAEAGKTVTVNLNIENNPGLCGYYFFVEADPEVFYVPYDEQADSAECVMGSACRNGTLITAPYEVGKGWQILWFGSSEADGTLCTLTLRVYDDAAPGSYPIKISYSPSNTFDDNYISNELPGLSVGFENSTEFMLGDIDGDGDRTNKDVILIARWVIGAVTVAEDRQFLVDVNGDGNRTLADAVHLARFVVGLEHTIGGVHVEK